MKSKADHSASDADWIDTLTAEALVFGLLGRALYAYPDAEWVDLLADQTVFEEAPLGAGQPDVMAGLALLQTWAELNRGGMTHEAMEALQSDYTHLFIGPGKVLAAPWESIYFNDERLVFQEQTLDVRSWYRRFGLEPEKLYSEPDDHIGLEMAFLAHLARRGLRALEEGDRETFDELLRSQHAFLSAHPLKWVGPWCAQVGEHATTGFYRGLALLTRGMLVTMAAILESRGCRMITEINQETLAQIRNPALAAYASIYTRIEHDFVERVRDSGIEMDPHDYREEAAAKIFALRQKGAVVRNDDKSLYINRISPACVACQTGAGSATFFISLKCHRSCPYCFNPNQEDYAHYSQHKRDCIKELKEIHASGQQVRYLGLTGGEPLLHKEEAVGFFRFAHRRFPDAHLRLYTCGDHVDELILQELKVAGLQEIRFSIRMHDLEKGQRSTFDRIALAKSFIPSVMVEMPVLPGTFETMKDVLVDLDRLQISSINLLELCFPYSNAEAFSRSSYKVKSPPYRVLYDYWYAGGLPIAGSELECLDLLAFALDRHLALGVHYCSLENKHTGQIYQQNAGQAISRYARFSQKDFFIKTAKVFGDDVPRVMEQLGRAGCTEYERNSQYDYLEFPVAAIGALRNLDVEVAVSTAVMEARPDGQYLRELRLDLASPQTFDPAVDA